MVKIDAQCINLYYTVLQYCDTKLTYEDDSVTHAVRFFLASFRVEKNPHEKSDFPEKNVLC